MPKFLQRLALVYIRVSIHLSIIFPGLSYRQMYRKFKKVVLGLPEHVTLSIFSSIEYLGVKLQFTNHIFFRTAVLRKLFDVRFSYKYCNFLRVCLLVKMASRNVTRSNVQPRNILLFRLSTQRNQ